MNFLHLWYDATHAKHGVVIETTDRHLLRQRLYKAREEADDPALKDISIVWDPINSNRLWLVKRKDNAPES